MEFVRIRTEGHLDASWKIYIGYQRQDYAMAVHMRQSSSNKHVYDAFVSDRRDIARRLPTKHQPTKNAGITLFGLTDV